MKPRKSRPDRLDQMMSALALGLFAAPAWAYLDPGTGSMIISAIVGLFATVGLAVKTYWYKLRSFFRRGTEPQVTDGEAAEPDKERPSEP